MVSSKWKGGSIFDGFISVIATEDVSAASAVMFMCVAGQERSHRTCSEYYSMFSISDQLHVWEGMVQQCQCVFRHQSRGCLCWMDGGCSTSWERRLQCSLQVALLMSPWMKQGSTLAFIFWSWFAWSFSARVCLPVYDFWLSVLSETLAVAPFYYGHLIFTSWTRLSEQYIRDFWLYEVSIDEWPDKFPMHNLVVKFQ